MDRCPVLREIFSYLPLSEAWINRQISKKIKEIINETLFIVNPIDVVAHADKLVTQYRILEAMKLLLPYIARHPAKSTPIVIMNRFILLIHSEIWDNSKYTVMRKKIFNSMKKKALHEINYYETHYDELKDKYQILKNIMAKMKITGKQAKPKHLGHDELSGKFGEVSYDPFAKPTVKHGLVVSGEAVSMFAYVCYKDKKFSTGFKIVNLALKMNSNNYLAYWIMGVYQHYYLKNTENSKQAYTKSFTLRPDFAYPYYSLGVLASDAGQNDKAIALYKQSMDIDPNHVYAHMNYCTCIDDSNIQELIERYSHIIEFHPTQIYCYRAVSRQYLNNIPQPADFSDSEIHTYLDNAEKILRKAIDIDPNGSDGALWLDLAFIYLRYRQDISEARKCFTEFTKRTTDDVMKARVNLMIQQLNVPAEDNESDDDAEGDEFDDESDDDEEDNE